MEVLLERLPLRTTTPKVRRESEEEDTAPTAATFMIAQQMAAIGQRRVDWNELVEMIENVPKCTCKKKTVIFSCKWTSGHFQLSSRNSVQSM